MNNVLSASALSLTVIASLAETASARCDDPPCAACKPTIQVCQQVSGSVTGTARGDIVFAHSTGDTGRLMGAMGLQMTHSGMMVSPSNVRHNTLSVDWLEQTQLQTDPDGLEWCVFGGVDPGDAWIDPNALQHGLPGLHTANMADEQTLNGTGYEWNGTDATGRILRAYRTWDESSWRARASSAAAKLEQMPDGSQRYDLYAFTNYGYARDHGGSMCAGSVYGAWDRLDPSAHGGFALVNYSAEVRKGYARNIHGLLYDIIYPRAAAVQDCSAGRIAGSVAQQITNAFAFGPFGLYPTLHQLTTPYNQMDEPDHNVDVPGSICQYAGNVDRDLCWSSTPNTLDYVSTGNSVSPDNLISQILAGQTAYSPTAFDPKLTRSAYVCHTVPNPAYPACLGEDP